MALEKLDGKIAVVTGAARGIGRALVEELVAQGASVCLADLDSSALEQTTREIEAHLLPAGLDDDRQVGSAVPQGGPLAVVGAVGQAAQRDPAADAVGGPRAADEPGVAHE